LRFRHTQVVLRELDQCRADHLLRPVECPPPPGALLNQLPADEAVMFADAVHPTHAARAVGCWVPKDLPVTITQSSGRGLWGLMHRHCTHNICYPGFKDFTRAVLTFLREKVPRNWHVYCDQVTDNFRVIDPADFRVLV
jgi:hypothetical protein